MAEASTPNQPTQLNSPLAGEFAGVAKALGEIEERLAFIVDRDVLADGLCEAVELGHRADALVARLALQCDANTVAALEGQRTIGQYVAARTNNRAIEIDRRCRTARWLRDFPVFEAAFGFELTDAHVQYIRKHLDGTYDSHVQLVADQQFFVDTAASCTFAGFTKVCASWLIHIDPDGKEPKDQLDSSRFRVRAGRGGRGVLDGACDAVTAADIATAVNHEANKLRHQDKETGVDRTDSQRRMAALANLVKRGFVRQDGTYPVPLGNIVMSAEVAKWALDTLNGQDGGETVPVHPTDVDGRCELIDGTPIHPFLAVYALGLTHAGGAISSANLRRYVLDADSRVLDVSVNARRFPEWMRTAALVQSRGACETPGCDSPHHWLEFDHVEPVDNDGETRFDNCQPSCAPDNQHKGAKPNQTAWRDRPPPPRRTIRHRPGRNNTHADADDDDADPDNVDDIF